MASHPKRAYGGPREDLLLSASQLETRESKPTQLSSFEGENKAWFISGSKQLFLGPKDIDRFPEYLSLRL